MVPPPDEAHEERDDTLVLLFMCCHPALTRPSAIALTLRAVGGLTTAEIASAFLVPDATMAQRISRAKQSIKSSGVGFAMPPAEEREASLGTVLHVLYLIFNEGYSASSGTAHQRVDLAREAIRLARAAHALLPDDGEVSGLLALMLLTDARRGARRADDGSFVRLADQDRTRWDRAVVTEGHELVRACLRRNQPGPFQLQAAIAAVHADAPTADRTDWAQIVALYDQLLACRPTAVVALNRAIAIGELQSVERALAELDRIDSAAVEAYQPFHAAHADLLARAGRVDEARHAYGRAIDLTANPTEHEFLVGQRSRLGTGHG